MILRLIKDTLLLFYKYCSIFYEFFKKLFIFDLFGKRKMTKMCLFYDFFIKNLIYNIIILVHTLTNGFKS